MLPISEFRDCVDFIYADPGLPLKRGHSYYIRVNEMTGDPRIVKVYREVT